VYATITASQTTSVGSNLALPDAIYFSGNTAPAATTGGNAFANITVTSPTTGTANQAQTAP
jgi:hypothetical protein